MKDTPEIKFDIIKTGVNAPVRKLNATWTMMPLDLAKWKKYHHDESIAYKIYADEIIEWVESQPENMWKQDTSKDNNLCYLFTEEMETWFLLRWS